MTQQELGLNLSTRRTRKAVLPARGETNLTVKFKRSVIRLRIKLTCQLADSK